VTVSQDGIYEFSFYYGGYAATADGLNAADDYVLSARARIVDSSNNVVLDEIVDWRIADAGGINGSWIDTPYTRQIVLSSGTYYVVFESLHFGGVDSNGNNIPNYYGPRIDGVNLSLVPEPASHAGVGRGSWQGCWVCAVAARADNRHRDIISHFSPSPVVLERGYL
jgi:hypothetical protein